VPLPKKILFLKEMYLNWASTAPPNQNPSDIAYPKVAAKRAELEHFKICVKKMVNAPLEAEVILNSGATESIANCVFWTLCQKLEPVLCGSSFDHPSVKLNCDNFGVSYTRSLSNRPTSVLLTHVCGRTGEICDIGNFVAANRSLQKTLLFLDASHSFLRVDIDMERWKLDCVFFSIHKLGGPLGTGVLIIADKTSFKPLIAGYQQGGLRGGTLDQFSSLTLLLTQKNVFLENTWVSVKKQFEDAGLNVYSPKGKHLFNTLLIFTGERCPLPLIEALAEDGVFIGNVSACANEINEETKQGIRLSLGDKEIISQDIISKIIEKFMYFLSMK
jgi:cysteine sulfinate desulfinase/cysteine desulfurase-like protein